MMTSSIESGARPARSSAARIAVAPNSGAVAAARSPWKPPMGVRTAEAMTTGSRRGSSILMGFSPLIFVHTGCSAGHWAIGLHANGLHETGQGPMPSDEDVTQGSAAAQAIDEGETRIKRLFQPRRHGSHGRRGAG